MTMGTQDEAVRAEAAVAAVAAVADSLASSVEHDPVADVQTQGREPDPHDVARQIVLRQLAIAPRSRAQLGQKLSQRGCPADVAAAVLDRMAEVGLVDDQAYAQMLVRSQQGGRGLAKRALARQLRTQGIEDDVAAEALAAISDGDEHDRARRLVDRRLRSMPGEGMQVQIRRLSGMLARKGYSSSVTSAVIREVIADAPEHLPD
jgi:regulatory protein